MNVGANVRYDEKLVEKAARDHEKVAGETKALYTRHSLGLEIPPGAKGGGRNVAINDLVKEIGRESRLRFDLVHDADGFASRNEYVKVIKKKSRALGKAKRHATAEDALGHYILEASESAIVVNVPAGKSAKLNFLFVCGDRNLPLEIVVNVGKGARLELFEWYGSVSEVRTIAAPLHVVNAGRESRSEISVLRNENGNTLVGAIGRITAQENSGVRLNALYNGGSVTKSSLFAEAVGAGSDVSVNEVVFGNAGQKFDLSTFLLNSNRCTRTSLRSGSVLSCGSHCILKGYAKVTKDAAGSTSGVEQRGLLLDSASKAQLLPDMSVECRDVESASHSASVAPMDDDGLFYLMSRGMESERARRAFVASFISKHLSGIGSDTVKEVAMSIMLDKFDRNQLSGVPRINARDFWAVTRTKGDAHEA